MIREPRFFELSGISKLVDTITLRSLLYIVLTICFGISWADTSTAALNYNYDVVEYLVSDSNIESEVQNSGYDDAPSPHYCCSNSMNTDLQKETLGGSFFAFWAGFYRYQITTV